MSLFNQIFVPGRFVLGFLLALFLVQPAWAVELYKATVPVASQSPQDRSKGLQKILLDVIVKVSGQSVLPASLQKDAGRVKNLVEQFGYDSRQVDGKRQLYLWAKLNPGGVKQLIRRAGLPVWPEERPVTLVWLAVEDGTERQILSEDSAHEVLESVYQAVDKRGLPIVLPLMDLAERSEIDYGRVAALNPEYLARASEKYASQYVLIGHVQRVGKDRWRARWHFTGGEGRVLQTPVGPLSDIMAAGIDPLASQIARQFSSFSYRDDTQYIDVIVDDIGGAADYARSLNYLESLSPVTQVDVMAINGGQASYRLHTRADIASVLQVIALGRVLYARDSIDQFVFGLNP